MAKKRKTGTRRMARPAKRAKLRISAKSVKRPAKKKTKSPLLPHPRKRTARRPAPSGPRLKLGASPYETGLDRNPANFQPLTPLSHLERAASAFPATIAVIHGQTR